MSDNQQSAPVGVQPVAPGGEINALVWFVKVHGALNAYWASQGVQAR